MPVAKTPTNESHMALGVSSGAGDPGPMAFSDDGTRLAYLFSAASGTLYVRPLH